MDKKDKLFDSDDEDDLEYNPDMDLPSMPDQNP